MGYVITGGKGKAARSPRLSSLTGDDAHKLVESLKSRPASEGQEVVNVHLSDGTVALTTKKPESVRVDKGPAKHKLFGFF